MHIYNSRHPGSFSGPEKLFKVARDVGRENVTLTKIKNWLASQEIYTGHREIRSLKRSHRIVVPYRGFQLDSDTVNTWKYASHNDGSTYVLVLIDILSRKAWTRPLKTLQGQESAEILKELLPPIADRLHLEYVPRFMKRMLQAWDIKHIFTRNETKAYWA